MTAPARPSFTCPRCSQPSAHPRDAEEGYCGRCHDRTAQGLRCPGCGRLAVMRIVGGQAFCEHEDCRVWWWDPDRLLTEQDWGTVDLSGWRG